MIGIIEQINSFVWGIPALVLILGVGLYLSFKTGFAQITMLPEAIKSCVSNLRKKEGHSDNSSAKALWTALAATVGTGNLAGVAGALALGGPGAVFWMWICALLGMITKFAEATLAVRYQVKNKHGEYVGGPMYMIVNGIGNSWSWLAGIYCFLGVVAAFGVGNATQINTVIESINSTITMFGGNVSGYIDFLIGVGAAILITIMLLGGAKRIGSVAEKLVPLASIMYLLLCIGVLIVCVDRIPGAFKMIVMGAFDPKAATAGALGSVFISLRTGASRGVFTNEAGMGTASIAHGSARVTHPVQQGFMGIIEVFIDTIVICTMTALVILCSGVSIPYGTDTGIVLTINAFESIYGGWIGIFITIALCLFAWATVLGWSLYGGRCAQYLFGENAWKHFVWLQGLTVVVSAIMKTGTVWMIAETLNGLMAIPNLIALGFLSHELKNQVLNYRQRKTGMRL